MKSSVNDLVFQSMWVQSRATLGTSMAQFPGIASGARTRVESDIESVTLERDTRTGSSDEKSGAVGQCAEESPKIKETRWRGHPIDERIMKRNQPHSSV